MLEEHQDGWWSVKLKNDVGMYPSNYLILLPQQPDNEHDDVDGLPDNTTKGEVHHECMILYIYIGAYGVHA